MRAHVHAPTPATFPSRERCGGSVAHSHANAVHLHCIHHLSQHIFFSSLLTEGTTFTQRKATQLPLPPPMVTANDCIGVYTLWSCDHKRSLSVITPGAPCR